MAKRSIKVYALNGMPHARMTKLQDDMRVGALRRRAWQVLAAMPPVDHVFTLRSIAVKLGYSKRTVERALHDLEGAGHVRIKGLRGRGILRLGPQPSKRQNVAS